MKKTAVKYLTALSSGFASPANKAMYHPRFWMTLITCHPLPLAQPILTS